MIRAKKSKDKIEAEMRRISTEIDRYMNREPGHGERVATIADRLARRFALSDLERNALRVASCLHGIGEFVMHRDYAKSAQPLKAIEIADFQRHPVFAEQELGKLRFDKIAQLTVRWSRENWDGSGYPDALREEEIPLVCRIHRVSEAFVSLIEKGGNTEEKALEELRRSAGIDFDPSVVAELVNPEMFAPKISDERHESEQSSAEVSE